MKIINWNKEKGNTLLQDITRGTLTFEDCAKLIKAQQHVGDIQNPTRENQRIFIVKHEGYVYAVPYIENKTEIFLKTIYKSRKLNKLYS
ncbi:toxin [Candidatus Gracilibacteria bacterium]|nr:toxin [Candidatus Gracilibacteria bacterium]